MEGWRARMGLLVPAVNVVMEPDFNRLAPEGVAVFASRIERSPGNLSFESVQELLRNLDRAATVLSMVGLDLLVFGCTTGSMVKGVGGDLEIANHLRELTGVPTITSSTAVVEAMKTLGMHRITIVSPSPDDLNERTAD